MIDLRSDTVTKPVPEMREAMAEAEVGDDVYKEDPTANALEEKAAKKFDKESALFVPSGSMGNQIAVNVHTQRSDEVILDADCHMFNFEIGTMSNFSGVMPRPIETDKNFLPVKEVKENIRPNKYYLSRTGLISLENTHNKKGGVIYPEDKAKSLLKLAKEEYIPVHLDGARIFNASVATNRPVDKLTDGFDSVMFCLSKGLGAPVGSMLVGSEDFIEKSRRIRKQLGGGMRQIGILAAAGIYALDNHVERLKEDHDNAKRLADRLKDLEKIELKSPETNILTFRLKNTSMSTSEFLDKIEKNGVLAGTIGPKTIRMVTHLGISKEDIDEAAEVIESVIKG